MIFKSRREKSLLLYNLRILVLAIAVVMIWRWVWNLVDFYFLPEHFVLSNSLTIVLWVCIMLLIDYDLEALWTVDE